jgi:hypothetical protein
VLRRLITKIDGRGIYGTNFMIGLEEARQSKYSTPLSEGVEARDLFIFMKQSRVIFVTSSPL